MMGREYIRRRGCKMKGRKAVLRVLEVSAAVFGAAVLFASTAAAETDVRSRTRITIRGTGAGVAIERSQEPARGLAREVRLPPGPLGDAIAMKLEGADDAMVIALLRRRQADLPPVIEAADVKLLRQAGAGKAVTQFLASLSAVDLGPMGEGHETVYVTAPVPPVEMEGPSYGYAVPSVYGYIPPIRHHHMHRFPHPRPVSFQTPNPVVRPIATRAAVGRLEVLP